MADFGAAVLANQRLVILRTLQGQRSYTAGLLVLRHALVALGHSVSMRAMSDLVHWLGERNLITTSVAAGAADMSVELATLTQHGIDVSLGYEIEDGVDRPPPSGVD